jgi:hypothetical protein
VAVGVPERHASVAGSSAGTARSLPAGLGPTPLGGVVVVEPNRVTPDSRGHRSRSPATLLKGMNRFSYPIWAERLAQAAGLDAPKIIEALHVVDLDVQRAAETVPVPSVAKKRTRAAPSAND